MDELVLTLLKEKDVFVDVGANIGYYTVLGGKRVGLKGRVICFEPVPDTARLLIRNIKLNNLGNVRVIRKAAWDRNQTLAVYVPKGHFGQSSAFKRQGADLVHAEGIVLDAVCSTEQVKLLKVDVEGSEYRVLRGARETLKRTMYVVLEASMDRDKIVKLLEEEGFIVRNLGFTSYLLARRREASP